MGAAWMSNDQICLEVRHLLNSACIELFAGYNVAVRQSTDPWPESDSPLLSGAIGFIWNKLHGTCLLAADEKLVHGSSPLEGRARDWIGELSNQLLGRLKSKLLARDIAVSVSTPVMLSGIHITPLPKGTLRPSLFSSPLGNALVWLELETVEGFMLPQGAPDAIGPEGELLLF